MEEFKEWIEKKDLPKKQKDQYKYIYKEYERLHQATIEDFDPKKNFKATVVLKDAGAQKLQVIKVIREVTGLGLKEAKDIADAGGNVKEGIPAAEADELKAKLEEAGATVELA